MIIHDIIKKIPHHMHLGMNPTENLRKVWSGV